VAELSALTAAGGSNPLAGRVTAAGEQARKADSKGDTSTPIQPAGAPAQPVRAARYVRGEDCNLVAPSDVGQEEGTEVANKKLKSNLENPGGLAAG
jgi:hypothetical protein